MDNITMEVRTRLDQLFSQYQPSRALTELKEELVGDLTEAVTEKMNQGMAADAALDEAMDQLGDIDTLLKDVAAENGDQQAADADAETGADENREQANDQTDNTADDDHDTTIHIDEENGEDRVQIGKLKIVGDKISWGDHVIVDGDNDKVDLGGLVKVDGDHVTVANGIVDVNGDDVRINGERPRRTYVESLRLVNTKSFSPADLNLLNIDYRDAAVKIGPAAGDNIVVNEYMSRDNSRFYLRSSRRGSELDIKQGDRPHLWPVHMRAEIFLPAQLKGKVSVHAGNGSLEVSDLNTPLIVDAKATNGSMRAFDDHVQLLNMNSTNGSVRIDQSSADKFNLYSRNGSVKLKQTTGASVIESTNGSVKLSDYVGNTIVNSRNGSVKFENVTGRVEGHTAEGSVRAQNLNGSGVFQSKNGSINVQVSQLTGDITAKSSNSSITVQMPIMTDYTFDAKNDDSRVEVPEEATLTLGDKHHKIGQVGDQPEANVIAHTKNGSVHIS
ncbi:DUF4097 family beta strand repeat-containing protein [Levilactobacillus andaensis]|uniref:DUF4097 family beta strand repeat-containing protein n=1 Tax=Levilactobacillus andaensis TaxID=2799570 RepID=UPI001942FBB6|nr:DUF4097 family beta strand repeat-containing protein [Levilactobacillus andaensis]